MISAMRAATVPQLSSFKGLYPSVIPHLWQSRADKSTTNKTASLVRDGVFKALFNDPQNPNKMISFLESMKADGDSTWIHKIEFQESYFPAYSAGEKDIYVDLICKAWDSDGKDPTIYVVEMQRAEQEGHVKRWEFYASRCYTNELLKAKTYDQLLKVHVIALMCHPCPYPNDCYALTGRNTGTTILESRIVTLLSLDQISDHITKEDLTSKKWLHLIKYSGTPELNIEALQDVPELSQAVEDLKKIDQAELSNPRKRRTSKGMPWRLIKHQVEQQISSEAKSGSQKTF